MRRLSLCVAFLLVLATGWASAQTPRTVKAVATVEAYRPVTEVRLWTYVSRDTILGRLASGIDSKTSVDGESGLLIKSGTRIDFQKIGGQQVYDVQTELSVSESGRLLADKMTFSGQDRKEEYNFERSGDKLEGYFTRNGEKVRQTVPWPRPYCALDAFLADQLEIYLSTRDLTERGKIDDTVFVPQILSTAAVSADIGEIEWREIWKGKFDSVIAVHFTSPQEMTAYITLDHRLIRTDYPAQNMRVYLDVVQKAKTQGGATGAGGLVTYVALGTHYLAYLVLAGLVALFLAAKAFRWRDAYFGLVFGGIVFAVALVTQYPAQKYIVANFVIPEIRQEGNLYFWGLLPSLAGGVIQELLKLLGIYALFFHREPPIYRWAKLGVFVALGFGLAEAVRVTEPSVLMSWQLFERGARLTFHAASGSLLAIALVNDSARRYIIIGGLMLFDTALIYLPIFVQTKAASPEALHFVTASVAIVVLLLALVVSAKTKLKVAEAADTSSADRNAV